MRDVLKLKFTMINYIYINDLERKFLTYTIIMLLIRNMLEFGNFSFSVKKNMT
jgi:hypothetical protein